MVTLLFYQILSLFISLSVFLSLPPVLGMELWASYMLGKHPTPELHPQLLRHLFLLCVVGAGLGFELRACHLQSRLSTP
jgi:hypothetical protein